MNKTNESEIKVKLLLESHGWKVFKPSYPDFLIYKQDKNEWAFVEVKKKFGEKSANQAESFHLMKQLGIPTQVIYLDDPDEVITKINHLITTRNYRLAKVREIQVLIRKLDRELNEIEEQEESDELK